MPLHPVSAYARELKPALSAKAFKPARSRLLWLPVHLSSIALAFGAVISGKLGLTGAVLLVPLLGISFAGLTFLAHETLHGAIVRGRLARRLVGFIGFLPFMVSPRLWIAWHNRVHHGNTNRPGADPDAYPTLEEYRGSALVRGMVDRFALGRGRPTGLVTLLVGFSVQSLHMLLVASRRGMLPAREHRLALLETALGVAFWATLAVVMGPGAFVLAYLLPLVVANALVMAYIMTNHSLSPLTAVNDPLANSLSVTVPRFFEWLTLGFGYHTEHHVFPWMSARHAPELRELIRRRWPERYQSMPLSRALFQVYRSPRVYKDERTLCDPLEGTEVSTLLPRPTSTELPLSTTETPDTARSARPQVGSRTEFAL
jgi:fatty acid desaturase